MHGFNLMFFLQSVQNPNSKLLYYNNKFVIKKLVI